MDASFKKYDAIIVLGENITPHGELSSVDQRRVERGVELFQKGEAPLLVMSGKWATALPYTPPRTEAEAMTEYALQLGAPPSRIIIEKHSCDTFCSAYHVRTLICEPRGWTRFVVVTSEYHLERTQYLWEKVFGPNYQMKLVGASSGMPSKVLEDRKMKEQRLLKGNKEFFGNIRPGNQYDAAQLLHKRIFV